MCQNILQLCNNSKTVKNIGHFYLVEFFSRQILLCDLKVFTYIIHNIKDDSATMWYSQLQSLSFYTM